MSASASKKKRKELELTPISEKKDDKKLGKKIAIGVIAAVLALALIITIGLLIKREDYKVDFDTKQAAMTVGDYPVTVPMFNYFYGTAYTNLMNNLIQSGYLNLGILQAGVPLSQQAYFGADDGTTWEDYLIGETKTQVTNAVNEYLAAKEAGYTLTDEDRAAINDSVKSIKKNARQAGYNFFGLTTDWYLSDNFGKGCNLENFKEYAELVQVISSFETIKEEDFAPTAEEIAAEYAENPNNYDLVSYALHTVNAEATKDDEGTETYSDEAVAKAKADADAAAADFPANASTAYNRFEAVKSSITEEAANWLFDAARKEGDTSVFASEDEHTYYVVRFDERDVNDYNLANISIISIPYDAADAELEDGTLPAAEKYAKLKDGAKPGISEEAFTALAEKYGLTANVSPVDRHALNDQIIEFLYDSARKDGDTFAMDDADASNYYVIRFSNFAEKTYQEMIVESELHEATESAWLEEVHGANTAEVNEEVLALATTDRTLG